MRKNILITGEPKSGKSILLEKVISHFSNKLGFLTKEIRKNNVRVGFEMILDSNKKVVIANVDNKSEYKVGKYFVYPKQVDMLLNDFHTPSNNTDLLYVDEIGQMQLLSPVFRTIIKNFLDAGNTCLATITSVYEDDFTQALKIRQDVILVIITPDTREQKIEFVKQLLKKIEKAKRYITEPERWIFKDNTHVVLKSEHGERKLILKDCSWNCDCEFFRAHNVCSHCLAIEDVVIK